jgi:hypothetical protein
MKYSKQQLDKAMDKLYHGWFSLKQFHSGNMGTAKYRSVDGHIVTITEVTATDIPGGNFDDFVYLGKVDKLIEPFPTLDLSKSFFRERSIALLLKMKNENDHEEAKRNDPFRWN